MSSSRVLTVQIALVFLMVLLSQSWLKAQAQDLCKGNLGANIFTDGNFGIGADPILRVDPAVAPGYRYVAYVPNDGEYSLTKNTANFNLYPTWLAVGDRSGDDGYIMVVNASFLPGIFYEKEVVGLCPNTLYEFSAEVINLIKRDIGNHILPNVAFLLDGQVKYVTGPVPQNEQWNKVGFSFITGMNQTSLKLTLRNNAEGGIGNDLALDNISFRPCGPKSFIDADTDKTIYKCKDGEPFKVIADIGVSNQYILWQVSNDGLNWKDLSKGKETEIIHDQFSPEKYYYRYLTAGDVSNIDNEKCRVISDQLLVQVLPDEYQVADTICEGLNYTFGDTILKTAGLHDRFFTSSLGCDSLVHLTLTHVSAAGIGLSPEIIDPNCFGEASGSIPNPGISGGIPPYTTELFDEKGIKIDRFERLVSGDYLLKTTDKFMCVKDLMVSLIDPEPFIVKTGNDTLVELGTVLSLPFESTYNDIDIRWDGPGLTSDVAQPDYRPQQSALVRVFATNGKGCLASDSIFVAINENLKIFYPNILSPGNSENGVFSFESLNNVIDVIEEFTLFDRWGNVFVSRTNVSNEEIFAADLKLTSGVYAFVSKIKLINGDVILKTGTINILN